MKFLQKITLSKALPWIFVIAGVIGLLCSTILTIDKMEVLKNPSFQPPCNLNPVLSCGSVMNSWQSSIFGFDNTLFGIAGFAGMATLGVAILAGATFKRWLWLIMELSAIGGVIFVHSMLIASLYFIHSLCPFCMVVWVITITTFWYLTLYNIQAGHIRVTGTLAQIATFARSHHLDVLVLWFLVIIGLILRQFWYYYGPGLGF